MGCFFLKEDPTGCLVHKLPIQSRCYAFSDGNGYMSKEVATKISASLGLKKVISAVQVCFFICISNIRFDILVSKAH